MARKLSKIGSLLGMESKARSRKAGSVDVAKVAGTRIPRMLFDTFGGREIPILESAFSKWEEKRNKVTDAKSRKHGVDQKYHKDSTANKAAEDMVDEARKSRQDAKASQQNSNAHQQKVDAYNSALADQGNSQLKALTQIKSELVQIKGVLRVGGKQVGGTEKSGSGGFGLGSIWNLLPSKMKGKLGGKFAGIAEKIGGKRIGSLVKLAATAAGAEGLEKVVGSTAAEVAGSGLGAAAKSVAPEAAGSIVSHAGGGILGKITGMGRSALGAAGGVVDSGKSVLGKVGGWFKGAGKGAEGLLAEGAEKLGGKEVGKIGGEEAGKLGGKLLLKEGGKAIPLLGNIIGLGTSLGFAGKRLWEGDLAGAAMEGGSGLLNLIPGVGNYLSIAADLAIAGRDLKRASAAKKLVGAGAAAGGAGKAAGKSEVGKTMKEVSEEGAKIVEEKADAGKEAVEGADQQADAKDKKTQSKLNSIASALNPIGTADAMDTIPAKHGVIKGITAAGGVAALGAGSMSVAQAKTNTKASPMDRLVSYMAGLFDLASDDQKGLYVRMAKSAFDTLPAAQKNTPSPAETLSSPAGTPAPSSGSISGASTASSPAASIVSPYSSSSSSSPIQAGAATNGGWAPGHATGKLHFNTEAGGASSSSIGAAPKAYGKVGGYDIDSMWDQMKGTIAQGESGAAGYDAHHGGTIQGLSGMTIGQLKKMKGAMGKYQLLPGTTLGMAARAVGLSDSDVFSPANQEAMGKYLFAHRVKIGAKGGAAGIQQQLAYEWASLPKDASGAGAYDGDSAGNMAAGGSSRGSSLASMISGSGSAGSVAGAAPNTANAIDSATQDVAKSSTDGQPTVVVAPMSGGGGGQSNPPATGTGGGLAGPMVTRNQDSSVQAITKNFIAGSSAMG